MGKSLIETVIDWCKQNRYTGIQLALSESQEYIRNLLTNTGFHLKQLYHKQLLGSALVIQMYNFEIELQHGTSDI